MLSSTYELPGGCVLYKWNRGSTRCMSCWTNCWEITWFSRRRAWLFLLCLTGRLWGWQQANVVSLYPGAALGVWRQMWVQPRVHPQQMLRSPRDLCWSTCFLKTSSFLSFSFSLKTRCWVRISEHGGAVLPAIAETLWFVTLRGWGERRKPGTLTTLKSAPQRARLELADGSRGGSVRGLSVVPGTSLGPPAVWGQTAPASWRETRAHSFGETGISIGSKWPQKNFFKNFIKQISHIH